MPVLLAIETSTDRHSIVLGAADALRFDSTREPDVERSRSLRILLSRGLAALETTATDISAVAVDIGPGGLNSIRAGVAFANALAFALPCGIYGFSSFHLLGIQARQTTELPIVTAVPAAGDRAYVGLFTGDSVERMHFGPFASTVTSVVDGISRVAVAGRMRLRLRALLGEATTVDTGIDSPSAVTLYDLAAGQQQRGGSSAARVVPLNDQSPVFYERS
jgi:tRNA threonylcarbamoyladenosine biosynthesis protein TsaB